MISKAIVINTDDDQNGTAAVDCRACSGDGLGVYRSGRGFFYVKSYADPRTARVINTRTLRGALGVIRPIRSTMNLLSDLSGKRVEISRHRHVVGSVPPRGCTRCASHTTSGRRSTTTVLFPPRFFFAGKCICNRDDLSKLEYMDLLFIIY